MELAADSAAHWTSPIRRFGGRVWTLLREDRALTAGLVALGLLIFLALLGPIFWPKNPTALDIGATLKPPSFSHPMGTDDLGRDVCASTPGPGSRSPSAAWSSSSGRSSAG